ncbi:AfsR/SARP family transcriptional regulator [Winogradskya humida]|uniref:AfsR/SARP family transcriptional regulator n=1 Tax=Winogradskya humida TaxID=113566 RepID=UPI001943E41E|nr:BTAD domain-containing putative transcriptional regulator [Actinoplanes humidus]
MTGTSLVVLGPVRAHRDGREIELGSPQQRAFLALLLAHAGEPVSIGALSEALWGGNRPATAAGILHRYAGALRRVLEPERPARAASGWIERTPGGYRFCGPATALDLLVFRRLAVTGGSVEALLGALRVWRGAVAADVLPGVRNHPVFLALERERIAVLKAAVDAALSTGKAKLVLPEIARAAAGAGLDEGLHARLITVLAVAGQRAAALTAYREIRDRLVRELGVEPGPELRRAHREVLVEETRVRKVPARLPADLATFNGRVAEMRELAAARDAVIVIGGMGGTGKTTLAVHWAHRIAADFPDGCLYANLRGFDATAAPVGPVDVLRGFLDELGVPAAQLPQSLAGLSAMYRSVIAGRRVLVLLDNARDDEQVRPLLPGERSSSVIVTSRNSLAGLVAEGARPIRLDGFSDAQARDYLSGRLGAHRVDAEPAAVGELIAACRGLPLALAIVAAQALVNPAFRLADMAVELRAAEGLDGFGDVRNVFSWSYRTLSPAAATLFRRLGLAPGPDIALSAVAVLAPEQRPREMLAELVGAHLITEHRPGRWVLHDLLRSYAGELAEDQEDRAEVLRTLFDHYVRWGAKATELERPDRRAVAVGRPVQGAPLPPFRTRDAALAWFNSEREVLLAALDDAARHRLDLQVCELSWVLTNPQDRWADWYGCLHSKQLQLAAAQRLGDPWWTAAAHYGIGRNYFKLGRHAEAQPHHRAAADILRTLNDPYALANAVMGLGVAAAELGDPLDAAIGHYREAIELFGVAGSVEGEALGHTNLADVLDQRQADPQTAIDHYRAARELHRGAGNRHGEAIVQFNLGELHLRHDRPAEAVDCYRSAASLFGELRQTYRQIESLIELGRSGARDAWVSARELLPGLDTAAAQSLRNRLDQAERDVQRLVSERVIPSP